MTVTVYSTKTCPWCVKAKEYLDSLNVSYEAIDVGANREAAMEMIQKTGQRGVPVILVEDTVIVGFDKNALDEALKNKGLV
ncbi:MAG TPA: glutaredoxin domain-containing protein [Synergistaceae bacterium]|nr:glutaredoxin domain-containing protein [Synergistaceae bacterium]HPJ25697.1 glutaredoxin domain-containing protein [Synergistaceae bacterium]HPQ37642.1 glutaredoxin domain-containing protein [Synergistaceae bacterium]